MILLAIGALLVLVAAGFGVAAVFHFIELRYGLNIALASVGGFFVILGVIGLIWGMALLKRSLPPVPRPTRQLQAFRRSAALDLLLRRDQMQSVARRYSTRLSMSSAGAVALGVVLVYGLVRLRSARGAASHSD